MLVSAFAGKDHIRSAYRHAIEQALPLLHLRRRDADRAGMKFSVTHTRRRGAARHARARARRGRDAGLHAGGHLRHGQGDVARRSSRSSARRSCSATPSTCGCGPGLEVIGAHGGLHRFMGWDGPILTDSGGFQVFSLGALRKISEEGVQFASPINGDRLFLTPEESMRIQRALELRHRDGVRRVHALSRPPRRRRATSMRAVAALGASARRRAHDGNANALFGIVQGGMYEDLRDESLAGLQRHRLRRLRDRRPVGGRAEGGLLAHPRAHRAAPAGASSRAT